MKVEILKLDHFGRGITFINDKICFVEKALPGEVVKIKIIKETKKYLIGKVIDYYVLSDERIVEECRYSDICGGCSLSHLKFDKENEYKCLKVKEILKKFGEVSEDLVLDTISGEDSYYRNKITLHGKDGKLGYCESSSNDVFNVDECLLASSKINDVLSEVRKTIENCFIDEVVIKVSNDLSEVMVYIKGEVDDYSNLLNIVDTLIINDEVILGEGMIISKIGSKKFYVSRDSFFQVNTKLTEKLYDEVLNVVGDVKAKKVLDLYCGAGTIGLYISDSVEEVVGVDYSKSGIEDANKNKELNNSKNIKFICDKVENVIDEFNDFDMVVVDPPRAGLDSKTIENIKRIGSNTLVYISCDPATLARDLKELSSDYEVLEVKPYNMFPRTYHIENFVRLKKK